MKQAFIHETRARTIVTTVTARKIIFKKGRVFRNQIGGGVGGGWIASPIGGSQQNVKKIAKLL